MTASLGAPSWLPTPSRRPLLAKSGRPLLAKSGRPLLAESGAPGTEEANARCRLICLPHAGGGTAGYHRWTRHLPPEIELRPVLLPGREARASEPPLEDFDELIAALLPAVRSLLDLPVALLGHSMGALIAFELARRLQQEGTGPTCLLVAAAPAPPCWRAEDDLLDRSDAELLERLRCRYGGSAAETILDAEAASVFIRPLRADLRMLGGYRYRPDATLSCPIVAMMGTDDASVSPAEVGLWRDHTTGRFTMRAWPGDHFFVTQPSRSLVESVVRSSPLAAQCRPPSAVSSPRVAGH